jgi:hypothetical protein
MYLRATLLRLLHDPGSLTSGGPRNCTLLRSPPITTLVAPIYLPYFISLPTRTQNLADFRCLSYRLSPFLPRSASFLAHTSPHALDLPARPWSSPPSPPRNPLTLPPRQQSRSLPLSPIFLSLSSVTVHFTYNSVLLSGAAVSFSFFSSILPRSFLFPYLSCMSIHFLFLWIHWGIF